MSPVPPDVRAAFAAQPLAVQRLLIRLVAFLKTPTLAKRARLIRDAQIRMPERAKDFERSLMGVRVR